jgi:hypothetical protein
MTVDMQRWQGALLIRMSNDGAMSIAACRRSGGKRTFYALGYYQF